MVTRPTKLPVTNEVTAIEDLIGDLEKRLRRLLDQTRDKTSEETDKAGDFISETLNRLMNKVRDTTSGISQTIADEATRVSGDAIKKLSDEVEHRPLLMLGVAAGIGFLVGLASRR